MKEKKFYFKIPLTNIKVESSIPEPERLGGVFRDHIGKWILGFYGATPHTSLI